MTRRHQVIYTLAANITEIFKMAKHGKELSDDNRKAIIKLIESGHRASQVAQSLKISKCTISRL
jgi:DNA invertase Pin-like site-specific DNA recombinase